MMRDAVLGVTNRTPHDVWQSDWHSR
jgi:hypothetical protein